MPFGKFTFSISAALLSSTLVVIAFVIGTVLGATRSMDTVPLLGAETIVVPPNNALLDYVNSHDAILYVGRNCVVEITLTGASDSIIGQELMTGPGTFAIRTSLGRPIHNSEQFGFIANGNTHMVLTKSGGSSSRDRVFLSPFRPVILADRINNDWSKQHQLIVELKPK